MTVNRNWSMLYDAQDFASMETEMKKTNSQSIQVYNKLATPLLGYGDSASEEVLPDQIKWFGELATRKWFVTLSITLPIAITAALEALQQVSDKQSGLVTVTQPSNQVIDLLPKRPVCRSHDRYRNNAEQHRVQHLLTRTAQVSSGQSPRFSWRPNSPLTSVGILQWFSWPPF